MRKFFSIMLMIAFLATTFTVSAVKPEGKKASVVTKATKVEVFYFHYSRRCITCNSVENVTKEAIAEMYPAQYKKGQIVFKSINLDEKASEAIAKKCQAEGQSLLFISKGKRIDLTDKGFMYAKNSPEKLKAEVRKTVDSLF